MGILDIRAHPCNPWLKIFLQEFFNGLRRDVSDLKGFMEMVDMVDMVDGAYVERGFIWPRTRQELMPPKPKALLIAYWMRAGRP